MSNETKIEAYRDMGRQAARCMNHRDMAGYEFERSYYRKSLAVESEEDKVLAKQAYDEGYREVARVPTVDYFR